MVEVRDPNDIIKEVSQYYKKKGPEAVHKLVYDSVSETLEPLYFWMVDLMRDQGLEPKKLIDNFTSSPGSGHFSELGQRATIMQQQGTKILADVNNVIRSVLNIVYDLRDFKIRLQTYKDINSGDKEKKEAARLSLKQIWMDKVDIQKGNSSIKAMALGQAGYQTLIDGFLVAEDEKLKGPNGKELDLNDRVKRIIKTRITEFNIWLKNSEAELKKRYEIERGYLKSQVNSLKLYSRWIKPYLKAAQELEMKEQGKNPDLVKAFNTIIFELTLVGKEEIKPSDEFKDMKLKRKYYSCVLVDFYFRGIPRKFSQRGDYVFGGRTEITFRGYVLNEDELRKFDEEMEKSDIKDVLSLIKGSGEESLEHMQKEIEEFLEEDEEENKKTKEQSNPFLALFGKYEKKNNIPEKKKTEKTEERIRPDDFFEKNNLRKEAAQEAKDKAFDLFDICKQAHGMLSF